MLRGAHLDGKAIKKRIQCLCARAVVSSQVGGWGLGVGRALQRLQGLSGVYFLPQVVISQRFTFVIIDYDLHSCLTHFSLCVLDLKCIKHLKDKHTHIHTLCPSCSHLGNLNNRNNYTETNFDAQRCSLQCYL